MKFKRDMYLKKLISKKENGLIKIITGMRRSGKSYLLFNLYADYLKFCGIDEAHIIKLALDDDLNIKYRNPLELGKFVREQIKDNKMYYVFLDEIQKVEEIQNPYIESKESKINFVDTLLGLMKIKNVDLYITGSNSKMLSSDILTEFKDRGDEIRVFPLSFREFYEFYQETKMEYPLLQEYMTYGGMPLAVLKKNHEEKSKYLKDLITKTYLTDVIERRKIKNEGDLQDLLNIIASSVGSLTNPKKLSDTFKTIKHSDISPNTISNYLDYFVDAFILNKALRYDVKGKKYINTPLKYYFTDIGLRNAQLNFRQQEESHIMENVIYNELLVRGFDIDVGVVEVNTKENGKSKRQQFEIDFIASKGNLKYYIQSALHIDDEQKRKQETNSLNRIDDSFKKIVVVKDNIIPFYDEKGIYYVGVQEFLLEDDQFIFYE